MSVLYIRNLDIENHIIQRLTKDLFDLAFRRLRLIQLAPILRSKSKLDQAERATLEAKMYQLATEYCKTTQGMIIFYEPYRLDWAVIRAFSWHSVATMLTMVLRHEALNDTPEARAASQRIESLFQNRPSIDYLAGNDNLWEPLRMLRAELAMRQNPVPAQTGLGTGLGTDLGSSLGVPILDTNSIDESGVGTSSTFDPGLFGMGDFQDGNLMPGGGPSCLAFDPFV